MSRRMENERLAAELAGVVSRLENVEETGRKLRILRETITGTVSRTEFDTLAGEVSELRTAIASLCGIVEGISDMIAESDLCPVD